MVFPAFGGETISPLWPLPIGEARSMIHAVKTSTLPVPCTSFNLSSGKYGVRFSNKALVLTFSGSSKFISELLIGQTF